MASAAEQLAANMNFDTFAKATELHKRIGFTLIALIVYRLGTYIPIPGIDPVQFAKLFAGSAKGLLGQIDLFSGGAVRNMAIFSLGVTPYISASIIVQLLGSVYPPWEKLRKEGGDAGRKQLNQYTRYLTVGLALFQAAAIALGLQNQGIATNPGLFFLISTVTTLTGGTMFVMWLGEQITSRGVGNGISLIIFAGIVARLPQGASQLLSQAQTGTLNPAFLVVILALIIGVVYAIVFCERAQRRLLIQYPKQQRGNRVFGGETSFLPLKINTSGVIPPIFASSLLVLPTMGMTALQRLKLPAWADNLPYWAGQLTHGQPVYMVLYAALIIFFCFFYTSVVFNPTDTAENLRKYGGFIPGIRPGARTADYLEYVLTRLTVIGAAYITLVCLLPEAIIGYTGVNTVYFGGTSILIVVSVTMDTVAQIQSHLLAHQYEGLIKKSRLRGARAK